MGLIKELLNSFRQRYDKVLTLLVRKPWKGDRVFHAIPPPYKEGQAAPFPEKPLSARAGMEGAPSLLNTWIIPPTGSGDGWTCLGMGGGSAGFD